MKLHLQILFAATLAFTGCDTGTDKPGHNPANAATDYLGAQAKAKKKGEGAAGILQAESAIKLFAASEGRNPKSLQELIDEGYLKEIPKAPYKMKSEYNPETGKFKYVAE
ncbi:MAG: hypothetical protein CMO80_03280 [Verrucomicrobiales bacterium]|nr:hypothetical protein [Verrucomicrobiales bacterium]|tara:strand:- start:204 stop:533 length:330 start_codon:yes stop_codon:yes gene_type:complete